MYTCIRPLHGLVVTVYTAEKGRVHGRLHGPYTAVYAGRVHGRVLVRVHGPSTQPHTRPVVYTARTRQCTRGDTGRYGRIHGPTRPVHGRVHGPVHGRVGVHVYTCIRAVCSSRTPPVVYVARTRPLARGDTARTRPCTRPVHALYIAV